MVEMSQDSPGSVKLTLGMAILAIRSISTLSSIKVNYTDTVEDFLGSTYREAVATSKLK